LSIELAFLHKDRKDHLLQITLGGPEMAVAKRMSSRLHKVVTTFMAEGPAGVYSKIVSRRKREAAFKRLEDIGQSDLSGPAKFEAIYTEQLWLKAVPKSINEDGSVSGHGSTEQSTRVFREGLERFLLDVEARTLLDAPCGDFNWMKLVKMPTVREYIGGEVVRGLVDELTAKYRVLPAGEQSPNRRFLLLDIRQDPLPNANVWLCKDCLQHLSIADIHSVLRNARMSSIDYYLFSNHTGVASNTDIKTGQFRPVDLTLEPFNLPQPFAQLRDMPIDAEARYIGIWRKEDLLCT
jgi:hypothetical protein